MLPCVTLPPQATERESHLGVHDFYWITALVHIRLRRLGNSHLVWRMDVMPNIGGGKLVEVRIRVIVECGCLFDIKSTTQHDN